MPKQQSIFFPGKLTELAKKNASVYPWAEQIREQIIAAAEPWRTKSDDELWALMFGPTIKRSWMVWSNGHCPACQKGVPMFEWKISALEEPWKLRCPHCKEPFPKNDFGVFYRSGLDEQGVFDPKRADRSLLFNAEHPAVNDQLHKFGVDDGNGYTNGANCWRFIGTYLIYGLWKQVVGGGIRNLSYAYSATGDPGYAHKAGVLLDRVADLYPTFDFAEQGVLYEKTGSGQSFAGYVSIWHDSNVETRELALSYDRIFEAIKADDALRRFLAEKSRQFKLPNPKTRFSDIQRNIEDRILRDALNHREKIYSNFPQRELLEAIILSVLDGRDNRAEIMAVLDPMIEQLTAIDGVSGEKGLVNYSAFAIQGLAKLLDCYARIEPEFLENLFRRHPRLRETFRFFVDTRCLDNYYPMIGDCGWFALAVPQFICLELAPLASVALRKQFQLGPMDEFLWRLHQATGDPAFAQLLYQGNGCSTEGLPRDLFAEDPQSLREGVRRVIEKHGATVKLGSINKQQWRLAILRSGAGQRARAAWLHYQSGGAHGHFDGLNLGLFALGLDLMPDFGYPPVQFGGWDSLRVRWYKSTAAHNTVVVDGTDQQGSWNVLLSGRTTLWVESEYFCAVRAAAPEANAGRLFERTVAFVDISERDFYIVDIFRVAGGKDHAKFFHSHFGAITTRGLSLKPAADYGYNTQMRNFAGDPAPEPGWSVDWKIEDRGKVLPDKSDVHLRYTDLTAGAQALTCEGWINPGSFQSMEEAWIPRVMVRRQTGQEPLVSTFVSVIEPYEQLSNIAAVRRIPLQRDSEVALEIKLSDGRRDLFVAADPAFPRVITVENGGSFRLDGELGWTRLDADGRATGSGKGLNFGLRPA